MDNGRIYKVLIIEPSAIVGAGIRTLLDGFSEFRALDAETTGDPATCFERVATTGPDLVLINPALFPVMRRTPIRNAFPMLQDVPIIALCHGAVDDELLHEFDGVINLYDSPGRVHHKLRQALEQTRTTAQPEGYELSERVLIKQIELKYLTKIKRLFYQLAVEGAKAPNVSQLAEEINTSRATVMNYIKYLADARLINMIYPTGQEFPKKPSKVMMHNSNLMYAIYPIKIDKQEVMETFFVNSLWKDHKVSQTGKDHYFIVDGVKKFRICDAQSPNKVRNNPDIIYARYNTEVGKDNRIPLWLLGFLY